MRKVKIVCTLGPACSSKEMLRDLAVAGMNVARFNFSHGSYDTHGRTLQLLREIEAEGSRPIATILDTKGPEIRTGLLENGDPVDLVQDSLFTLLTEEQVGNAEQVSVSYDRLPEEVAVGESLFIDDGSIHLRIENIRKGAIECRVLVGGRLGERKGLNAPGANLSVPTLTAKDIEDIRWGTAHDMDYLAVSFVRNREDIMQVRRIIEGEGSKRIGVIAKIETRQSVDNLEDIIQVVDGVMVARGDLGVEMPTEEVPIVQKRIIELCRASGKPVIVATQMLDSMIRNPRPTRAEASDVANAVLDGADAVMLSGETANGKYPLETVRTMLRITERAERELTRDIRRRREDTTEGVADSVSHGAMQIADKLNASAIISLTRSGSTASMVSKHRPDSPIIAATPLIKTWRALTLMWGVYPILLDEYKDTETAVDHVLAALLDHKYVCEGDTVVITTGFPVFVSGTTNMVLIQTVGRVLLHARSLVKREATGEICKAHSAAEANEKMEESKILVVANSGPDYLPAIKKASAIITEETGMTSFTAITALQLGIPCMTAARGAMERLREGAVITVDGVRGVVYEGRVKVC